MVFVISRRYSSPKMRRMYSMSSLRWAMLKESKWRQSTAKENSSSPAEIVSYGIRRESAASLIVYAWIRIEKAIHLRKWMESGVPITRWLNGSILLSDALELTVLLPSSSLVAHRCSHNWTILAIARQWRPYVVLLGLNGDPTANSFFRERNDRSTYVCEHSYSVMERGTFIT